MYGPLADPPQSARKKLESRRLAYDASLAKMQKAKKEDFRVEEELRSQKAKYEETSEDVYRRMQDVGHFSSASHSTHTDDLYRLKRLKSTALLILGHSWTLSSSITTAVAMCCCN